MAESLGLGLCGSVGLLSSLSSESASLHGVDTSGHIVDCESQLVLILRRNYAKGEVEETRRRGLLLTLLECFLHRRGELDSELGKEGVHSVDNGVVGIKRWWLRGKVSLGSHDGAQSARKAGRRAVTHGGARLTPVLPVSADPAPSPSTVPLALIFSGRSVPPSFRVS